MATKISIPDNDLIQTRKEGMALTLPIGRLVADLKITSDIEYAKADLALATIRQRRGEWLEKTAKTRDSLKRAKAEIKEAEGGFKEVFEAIDGPMATAEGYVKDLMRDYKLAEARRIEAAEEEKRAAEDKLRAEIEAKQATETKAKSDSLKLKLAQQRAELEQRLANSRRAESIAKPVKAQSSTARTVRNYCITDMGKFIVHVAANLEKLGSLLELSPGQMEAFYRLEEPGIGEWMPGVEVYYDVVIANKRR
jgi:chromosome segregation ATPase